MPFQNFLQAREWQSFQQVLSKKTWRIFAGKNNEVEVLVIEERFLANKKKFLYIPYGCITEDILEKIKKIGREQKAIFLLIEPFQDLPQDIGLKLKPAIKRYQPQKTLLFDLTKTKDQLLADLNQSTRRNLKIAEKADIKFVIADNNDEKAKNDFAFLIKIFAALLHISSSAARLTCRKASSLFSSAHSIVSLFFASSINACIPEICANFFSLSSVNSFNNPHLS